MTFTLYAIIFFLWAVFGSFWWVIVERGEWWFAWSEWKNILWWRSFCPWCDGKTLVRWQLIPLLWWLFQWGKCFRCKSQIPVRYCYIELLMWLVFVATTRVLVWVVDIATIMSVDRLQVLFWVAVNWLLVLIIIADLLYYELNVYAWMIIIPIQLAYLSFLWVSFLSSWVIGSVVLCALFYMLYVWAKRYATKKFGQPAEGIWEGDVLMAISLGLFTPFIFEWISSISSIVSVQTIFIYMIISSLLWIIYRVARKAITWEDNPHMPFLPAMIVTVWILLLWGGDIVWMLSV